MPPTKADESCPGKSGVLGILIGMGDLNVRARKVPRVSSWRPSWPPTFHCRLCCGSNITLILTAKRPMRAVWQQRFLKSHSFL
eukprot:2004525-Amphidinium_carterae.3